MFSWGALAAGLTRHAYRTAKGTAVKAVRCEACNHRYDYQLSRVGVGHSSASLTTPDYEAAQRKAADDLRKRLERACDPVPCPACGWYQHDMVARARQLRYGPLLGASVLLFFLAGILSLAAPIIALSPSASAREARSSIPYFILLLVLGVSLATAVVCLALRFLLALFFDPNRADVTGRIELGRSRALPARPAGSRNQPRAGSPRTGGPGSG
jgi:hypothetical protein